MIKTAAAVSLSDTALLSPRRSRRMPLQLLIDRLEESKTEWSHIVEDLGQQRSIVRALARSVDKTAAQLAHADHALAPETAPDAVAEIQKRLDTAQDAYDEALRSYERSLAKAELARVRLHGEMDRLRKKIRAHESDGSAGY